MSFILCRVCICIMPLQTIEKSRNNWYVLETLEMYVCVWLFRTKKTSQCEPYLYHGRIKTCKHEVNNVSRIMTMVYAKYLSITDLVSGWLLTSPPIDLIIWVGDTNFFLSKKAYKCIHFLFHCVCENINSFLF